jgi:hypothetical protein
MKKLLVLVLLVAALLYFSSTARESAQQLIDGLKDLVSKLKKT